MKRILIACLLLTAAGSFQKAHAQSAVSASVFTAQINTLDSLISVGDIANATVRWNFIHDLMINELGATKANIASASTSTAASAALAVNTNQYTIYNQVWALKPNLAANRVALHAALVSFAGTL